MAIQKTETGCGCTVTIYGDGSAPLEIEYCGEHSAAKALVAALGRLIAECRDVSGIGGYYERRFANQAGLSGETFAAFDREIEAAEEALSLENND